MDINYLLFLQQIRTLTGGIFDSLVLALTSLGEAAITWGLLALVYWCVDKRTGQLMALNVSFASTLNQGIKNIFKVERPWGRDERIAPVSAALSHAGGYSFPSGHTTRGTAVWGAWAKRLWKQKEKALAFVCMLVCLMVAFSRNYLGVHTPQDVLVALGMGVVLIFVLDWAYEWVENGRYRDFVLVVVGCFIFMLVMLKVGCLTNAGAGAGILFGWLAERRFIKFKIEGRFGERAFRFLLGSFVLVFFYTFPTVVLKLFMPSKYAGFFSNFLFTFVLMAGYPFVFSKLQSAEHAYKKMTAAVLGMILFVMMLGLVFYGVKVNLEEQVNETQEGNIIAAESSELQEDDFGVQETVASRTAVIAHRGYSAEFPENTLAAFEGACELGVDYIEMDVQSTKDGVLVIFHDTALARTTGAAGNVIDYTYEELCALDAGSWFGTDFAGEKIPTLQETMEYLRTQECNIYLELKDIGEAEWFAESVAATVAAYDMTERCVFASFNYKYLQAIKEQDAANRILYNTMSDKTTMVTDYPAEYYGLYLESVSPELVNVIHAAGSSAFVWTVDKPQDMMQLMEIGVDGICTNQPSLANVLVHREYAFLTENYISSFTIPGLYEKNLQEVCDAAVVQGMTKTPYNLIFSAYSKTGANSILYVTNLQGNLQQVVDLEFSAEVGGIAYDSENDYLWVTGPKGMVYAISCSKVLNGTYAGEILVSFDAGLSNHAGEKVASFLTYFERELFVGSLEDGANGMLNRFNLTNPAVPQLVGSAAIPEKIQGLTLWRNNTNDTVELYLSQSSKILDSVLLQYFYQPEAGDYTQPSASYCLPEGLEQVQATVHGMYFLFDSGVKSHRETARVVNDRVYLVEMP